MYILCIYFRLHYCNCPNCNRFRGNLWYLDAGGAFVQMGINPYFDDCQPQSRELYSSTAGFENIFSNRVDVSNVGGNCARENVAGKHGKQQSCTL